MAVWHCAVRCDLFAGLIISLALFKRLPFRPRALGAEIGIGGHGRANRTGSSNGLPRRTPTAQLLTRTAYFFTLSDSAKRKFRETNKGVGPNEKKVSAAVEFVSFRRIRETRNSKRISWRNPNPACGTTGTRRPTRARGGPPGPTLRRHGRTAEHPVMQTPAVAQLKLTAFQEKVFRLVRTIPPGKVSTYGRVANAVGGSARAVGQARNHMPPTHARTIARELTRVRTPSVCDATLWHQDPDARRGMWSRDTAWSRRI